MVGNVIQSKFLNILDYPTAAALSFTLMVFILVGLFLFAFFFQAEDGIRDYKVTGVQTCALPISCEAFAQRLLAEQHVAVLAGTAFGPGGAEHLRMCYATEPAELERAVGALRRFV